MNIGDVVTVKTFKAEFSNDIAHGNLTYKAEKGKVFVLLLLGQEDISLDGEKLNCEEALNSIGWTSKNG